MRAAIMSARHLQLAVRAETVASHTGAKVVEVTQFPGGIKGTEGGYIQMEDYDVNAIAAALAQK